jgi:hypothetical protein
LTITPVQMFCDLQLSYVVTLDDQYFL